MFQIKYKQLEDMLQYPEHNPNSVSMFERLSKLKSELDSEQNRLNYAQKKLKNA